MRIRLVHQLALSLAAAVSLSVLAVSGLIAWNLTGGFTSYMQQRESERLDRFARYLAEQVVAAGSLEAVLAPPQGMRMLVDGFLAREGAAAPAPDMPFTTVPRGAPPAGTRGGPEGLPRRASDNMLLNVPLNVQIADTHGARLSGFSSAPAQAVVLEQSIKVGTRQVGTVRLAVPPRPRGIDAEFLQRQYTGVLLATGGILACAIALGIWMARRWSLPLQQLRAVTRELALGHFEKPAVPPRAALEIGQLFEDVTTLAASLKRLETSRRQWIAQISHELRSPLSVLRGEIESVEDGAREPSRALVLSLADEVEQLGRIVNDLHLLAVADLGALPCHRVEVDACEVLHDIVARQLRQPSLAGLAVSVVEPPLSPIRAAWDPGRVEQVVANLVQNSALYTTRPGQMRISWGRDLHGADVFFEVEDSAPGVAAEDMGQIFEPLFRGDRARGRDRSAAQPGGSGLGLAIARAIIATLGGSMQARASPLGGLAIRFVLPAAGS
jgi:two-component system, OmpR family, sensor histidine kinase BaeS